jgi:hypothetical protein
MEEAFISTNTWRSPGTGTGYSRVSTVLFPGSTTPVIVSGMAPIVFSFSPWFL